MLKKWSWSQEAKGQNNPFTVTHFYFFPFLVLTFYVYSSISNFLVSFIFYHQAFYCFCGSGLLLFWITWGYYYFLAGESAEPKVGNISFIFFWKVAGFSFTLRITSLNLSSLLATYFFYFTKSGNYPLSPRLKSVFIWKPCFSFFLTISLRVIFALFSSSYF